MSKVKRQILHNCLEQAKLMMANNQPDKARDYCDMGIGYVASKRENGYGV